MPDRSRSCWNPPTSNQPFAKPPDPFPVQPRGTDFLSCAPDAGKLTGNARRSVPTASFSGCPRLITLSCGIKHIGHCSIKDWQRLHMPVFFRHLYCRQFFHVTLGRENDLVHVVRATYDFLQCESLPTMAHKGRNGGNMLVCWGVACEGVQDRAAHLQRGRCRQAVPAGIMGSSALR